MADKYTNYQTEAVAEWFLKIGALHDKIDAKAEELVEQAINDLADYAYEMACYHRLPGMSQRNFEHVDWDDIARAFLGMTEKGEGNE